MEKRPHLFVVATRLTESQHTILLALSKLEDRSPANILRVALREYASARGYDTSKMADIQHENGGEA